MHEWLTQVFTPDFETGIVAALILIIVIEVLDKIEARADRKRSK